MILDNKGGFSHGGRRIELFEKGVASSTSYSDTMDDRVETLGSYDLGDDVLVLRFGDERSQRLYRVSYGDEVYWVLSTEKQRLLAPDAEWLRQISLQQE